MKDCLLSMQRSAFGSQLPSKELRIQGINLLKDFQCQERLSIMSRPVQQLCLTVLVVVFREQGTKAEGSFFQREAGLAAHRSVPNKWLKLLSKWMEARAWLRGTNVNSHLWLSQMLLTAHSVWKAWTSVMTDFINYPKAVQKKNVH